MIVSVLNKKYGTRVFDQGDLNWCGEQFPVWRKTAGLNEFREKDEEGYYDGEDEVGGVAIKKGTIIARVGPSFFEGQTDDVPYIQFEKKGVVISLRGGEPLEGGVLGNESDTLAFSDDDENWIVFDKCPVSVKALDFKNNKTAQAALKDLIDQGVTYVTTYAPNV